MGVSRYGVLPELSQFTRESQKAADTTSASDQPSNEETDATAEVGNDSAGGQAQVPGSSPPGSEVKTLNASSAKKTEKKAKHAQAAETRSRKVELGNLAGFDLAAIPGDPSATVLKMELIQAAALAPTDPLARDKVLAAEAARVQAEAQVQLNKEIAFGSLSTVAADTYAADSPLVGTQIDAVA